MLSVKWAAWKDDVSTSRKVFVLGCGRSGTHLVGHTLQESMQIHVDIERPYAFRRVTAIALNPQVKDRFYPELVRFYRWRHACVAPKHFVDKSHPNIWLAESLSESFPKALFIGIWRNPFATVASMLKHKGVQQWYRRWKEFPVPNRFLGITEENAGQYEGLPLESKCALRWQSHFDQLRLLEQSLGERLCTIFYDEFVNNPKQIADSLGDFLQLESPLESSHVRSESLDRWKFELSEAVKENIRKFIRADLNDSAVDG